MNSAKEIFMKKMTKDCYHELEKIINKHQRVQEVRYALQDCKLLRWQGWLSPGRERTGKRNLQGRLIL